jgi:hypothetical protein
MLHKRTVIIELDACPFQTLLVIDFFRPYLAFLYEMMLDIHAKLDFPVPSSAPTVPKSGTVVAKTPLYAPVVPVFGTVGALPTKLVIFSLCARPLYYREVRFR